MRVIGISVCLLAFVWVGCGGEDEEASAAVDASVVADGSSEADAADEDLVPEVTPLDSGVCDEVLERINSCGLYYSFETFEADCAEWAATAQGAKLDALEACLIKPCQPLTTCLEDAINL